MGHGAFFGVGAYGAAFLATRGDVPFLLSVPAAGLITALVGLIFGLPSSRLKGLYLTIATLAGQFIIEYVLVHWEDVTQGTMGITLPKANVFGLAISGDVSFFYVIFIALLLMLWLAINLMRTKYGRAFVAIRDNDRAAEGMGIPIFPYKLLAFAISSLSAAWATCPGRYMVYNYFPRPSSGQGRLLQRRRAADARHWSGPHGQRPELLLLDEPSLGLAPPLLLIVRELFGIIKKINAEQGATIVLVEQNANTAMSWRTEKSSWRAERKSWWKIRISRSFILVWPPRETCGHIGT